jgi:hypothetical protein
VKKKDRGRNLPAKHAVQLLVQDPLSLSLDKGEGFQEWWDSMIWMLKGYRLDRLVDSPIPRPVETNKTYQYWFEFSILVSAWLEQSLDMVPKWEMIKSGCSTIFVDGLMKQIRAHCAGEGLTGLGFVMTTFMDAKRDSFNTSEEFVIALQRRFRTYYDLGYIQPPVSALLIMLRELKYIPELDKFIRLRYDAFSKLENPAMAVIFQTMSGTALPLSTTSSGCVHPRYTGDSTGVVGICAERESGTLM